jgi:signal peptidase I
MALDAEDLQLLSGPEAWATPEALGSGAPYLPVKRAFLPFDLSEVWSAVVGAARLPVRFLAVGMLAYVFAFNFSVVRGSSMAPGIHDGDRILIDQLSYLFLEVERGDIVVLQYPLDPRLDYIKRVVGLPGDRVVMTRGKLWVNGKQVPEVYLKETDPYTRLHLEVSPEHFFVLGDNRLHSSDSREFGQVHEDLVRGKVDIRLWPPGRIGRVE